MSGKGMRETIGFLGVIISLGFVGTEVRQSNVQAKAAAYQEIGIATADWFQDMDETLIRLFREAQYPQAIARWDGLDWQTFWIKWVASLRLSETVLLQVEQRLLGPDAMERLGYFYLRDGFLAVPGQACLWPFLSVSIGPELREYVEATPASGRHECSVDVQAVWDAWATEDTTN